MQLSGLHILLTHKCTCECDHCFVWGSPRQKGNLTLAQVENVLQQAREAGVTSIYFEGGEPFLFYSILLKGVHKAAGMGFEVGVVSNAYWAGSVEDALEWLEPFAGLLADFTVSSDLFHCSNGTMGGRPQNALLAAARLNIPVGMISIARPGMNAKLTHGQMEDEGAVVFRGRAAESLVDKVPGYSWEGFDSCPHEDLREPGRVHLDPLGNLHVCQGLTIGNLFERPLKEICGQYDADAHPICGPLLAGGPAALVTEYNLPRTSTSEGGALRYADACHLCYSARIKLRERFPEYLHSNQMYGIA